MTEFITLQRRLVKALMAIPGMQLVITRNSLLDGIPSAPLQRSETSPQVDLNSIVSGLQMLGRLSDEGGTRPLIILIDNALQYVSTGEVAEQLNEVKEGLASYYGGDTQPVLPTPPATQVEQLIFGRERDTRLPFAFVEGALLASQGIARLRVPQIKDGQLKTTGTYGTGWLVARGMLLTNHHVINARDPRPAPLGLGDEPNATESDFQAQAAQVTAWFDYHREGDRDYVECQNATLLAADKALDYALIELADAEKVADRAPLQIISSRPELKRGARLNIAQHSRGGPLQYAVRNNFFVAPGDSESFVRYQTDTESGASGSPVFDDQWRVIAMHHGTVNIPPQLVPQEIASGSPAPVTILNEAVDIHAILESLPDTVRGRITSEQH